MKKAIKILCVISLVILLALMVCVTYFMQSSYSAGEVSAFAIQSDEAVTVMQEDGYIVFLPEQPQTAFVFYPGGSVEHTAYAPLLRKLAENHILCILVEMPMDLAILDMYAAEDIPERYPEITNWFIGGHSLGGSSASYHLNKTEDDYRGLVLLASYSTVDLRNSGLKVCSLYGSEDGILNMENYQSNKSNLPADFEELIIDGGNHSLFADYGQQKNDGIPTITAEEQIGITTDFLVRFFAN